MPALAYHTRALSGLRPRHNKSPRRPANCLANSDDFYLPPASRGWAGASPLVRGTSPSPATSYSLRGWPPPANRRGTGLRRLLKFWRCYQMPHPLPSGAGVSSCRLPRRGARPHRRLRLLGARRAALPFGLDRGSLLRHTPRSARRPTAAGSTMRMERRRRATGAASSPSYALRLDGESPRPQPHLGRPSRRLTTTGDAHT